MRTRRSRRTDRGRAAGSADGSTEGGALARRRKVLVAVVVGAVILSGVGIAASTVIKSPAQVAAEAGAPERDVLTAQVESRVLKESVILRGKVVADRTVTISPSASVAEGAASIVTKLSAKAGDKVEAGRVLVEISGRPVFALRGALPVYRDLKPGARGDDVTQLQQALAGLGFGGGGDPKGEFGAGTQAALASYYESIGYDPRPVSEDGPSQVGAATEGVTAANRALQDIRADGASDATAVTRAEEDLANAQRALDQARLQAGAMLPASEVVVLDRFPARVESVRLRVGDVAASSVMTISSGALAVQGTLTSSRKSLVRTGHVVRILSELTGDEFSGVVTALSDPTTAGSGEAGESSDAGSGGGSEGGADMGGGAGLISLVNVKPDKEIPAELAGQEVRLTVEAATSKGKVLVVPVTAVSAAADGSTVVTVLEEGGEQRRVKVRTGLSGDGYVEITPAAESDLAAGEKVIVGTENSALPGEGAAP
ncbi:peptidoglycan-binding protein [Streptomyces niveus]|uniref:peptidoglycan-binding protein n=1 Tax=Streptomyces niveus TaxID=193462 RepID=UPI0035E21CDF